MTPELGRIELNTSACKLAATPAAKRKELDDVTSVLVIAGIVVLLIALLLNLWWAVLLIAAVLGITLAVVALITGSAPKIKSRRAGTALLLGSVLVLGVGSVGATAAVGPSAELTASDASTIRERPSQTTTPTPTPNRTVTVVEERHVVPFTSSTVEDGSLPVGTSGVHIPGANGERVISYEVVREDGVEVARKEIGNAIVLEPVNEVIAQGTLVPPPPPPAPAPETSGCHPSYEGECVGFASDADCAAGSGNGPIYVVGPVRVVGPDVYDLDRDGDGIACDA